MMAAIPGRNPIPAAILLAALVTMSLGGCSRSTQWTDVREPEQSSGAGQVSSGRGPGNPPFYEVFGQRYYVMPSSAGYRERGVASWYGKKFHGRRTSNGEIYDMYAMTAAHKTLPIPTQVRVTNLSNGRNIVVRVNDRGPFVHNRVIDLSYAAAKQLDMIRNGTAMVEVSVLPTTKEPARVLAADDQRQPVRLPSAVATAQASAPDPDELPTANMFLQVGAFREAANALQLKQRLEANALDNVLVLEDVSGPVALYRVRLGPLADVAEYDALLQRMEMLNIGDPHLVTDVDGDVLTSLPGS